ncbi:MAG: beta-galactosidase trimerization domain-containing protein [Planctomycetota bacterium]
MNAASSTPTRSFHPLRFRQVHLDFHTSPHIPGIGESFDEKHWQETLRRGHVDSITLFATCHHGYAYYDTQVGERHPHLSFDLLRRQFDATKAIGVKAPIYLTAGVNNWAAEKYPGWREVDAEGRYMGWVKEPTQPGFHTMCFNTPYLDLLCEQIREVVRLFPDCDGIFLDIIHQRACCCPRCVVSMREAGLDITREEDRVAHAQTVLMKYYRATTAAAKVDDPDMPIFHNSGNIQKGNRELLKFFSHLELESLPTGGWGYDHFPLSARYVSQLPHDVLGMTGKFHTTWGEFGGFKHPNALRYECAAMIAHGTKCSVGDQLHPSGRLDESTYDLIGHAYAEVEAKEPYVRDAVNVADIGLLSSSACDPRHPKESIPDNGAARILLEGHFLFDVLDREMDFDPYKLLILPDDIVVDAVLKAKIDRYAELGGQVLLTGRSGLNDKMTSSRFDLGAALEGPSPFQPDYVLPAQEFRPDFTDSPVVTYLRAARLRAEAGVALGEVYDPYFNRTVEHFCSHQHTPNRPEPLGYHMGVRHGAFTFLAHPWFTLYAGYGAVAYRHIVTRVIEHLLGEDRTLRTNLPSTARVVLTRQDAANRYVLHLLYANTLQRGGPLELSGGTTQTTRPVEVIEELLPLHGVEVTLSKQLDVSLADASDEVRLESTEEGHKLFVKQFSCHRMIVLDRKP